MIEMKTFKNIGEMKPYYNEETNTYEFYENGRLLGIAIKFNLDIRSHIVARDITGNDINAWDIKADNIKANDITFYAVCCAYSSFKRKSIRGKRKNAKYFCLDSEVKVG